MAVQTAGEQLEKTVLFGSAQMQGAGVTISKVETTCIFGELHIDLRSAKLEAAEVGLETMLLFGSVELRVPASWRVITDVQPLFGSVEERGVAPAVQEDAPTLRIGGTVVFASLTLERF